MILGVAVLLDAFLVRLTLLPVFLRLSGSTAWYLPAWLERLLPAVRFGHGDSGPTRAPDVLDEKRSPVAPPSGTA